MPDMETVANAIIDASAGLLSDSLPPEGPSLKLACSRLRFEPNKYGVMLHRMNAIGWSPCNSRFQARNWSPTKCLFVRQNSDAKAVGYTFYWPGGQKAPPHD